MKRKFYVIMAVLSGLIFGLSLFYYLKNMQNSSNLELKPLVVAAMDIPARTIVQANQLEIKKVPGNGYPQGGASSIQEVSGKVLLVGIKKGDVLLSPMLEPSFKAGSAADIPLNGFSLTVPEGKRALAIPVSQVGSVGYKVKPGDRVDVLVTIDIKAEGGSKTVTSLAAQDVLVLNTGETTAKESEKTQGSGSYILAVNVSQAMAVTLGSEKGSIRLLLRNPANKEVLAEPPVDPNVYYDPNYFNHYK
ncbi:MAG: Flp pilus assembly protein CpaB [Peptococcaceae bacterium]|nr:Flp pilus assembly protein CpaB [Peptococcaceae bacterium]